MNAAAPMVQTGYIRLRVYSNNLTASAVVRSCHLRNGGGGGAAIHPGGTRCGLAGGRSRRGGLRRREAA
jgi:hypothetical protein